MSWLNAFSDLIDEVNGRVILETEPQVVTAPIAVVEQQIVTPTTPQWQKYVDQWRAEGRIAHVSVTLSDA